MILLSHKEIGHQFLARLGKKRLRPGGVQATNWLIKKGHFSADSRVLEVACNHVPVPSISLKHFPVTLQRLI